MTNYAERKCYSFSFTEMGWNFNGGEQLFDRLLERVSNLQKSI